MKKHSYVYQAAALLMVAVLSLHLAAPVYAQEVQSENKVVKFFKGLVNWPFGVTKKSAETVGRTTERAVTTTTKTGTSAVEMVTGKPEKIKDVVVEPIQGSAETAYTAVEGTVKAPVEAAEESF